MVIGVALRLRVGMDQRGGQARHRVQQAVLGVNRDLVCLDGAGTWADDDLAFGPQLMADPPQPDLADAQHSLGAAQRLFHLVHQGGVDGVYQPPVDLPRGLAQHRQDRHRDEQSDDRVGPIPAHRHTAHAEQHRQGGEPVGAGMQPIGHQGRLARGLMRMRAQPMPEPFGHSWPAGMAVLMSMGMSPAGLARLHIAHDAQHA